MLKITGNIIIGICPICDREMWKGPSIDKHHFLPKSKGGKETEYLHKICHRKIHSLFKNKELAKEFNNPEFVRLHPEILKFIKWISKKDPDFYDKNDTHNRKKY
jgi:hypothetical protein